MPLRQAIVDSCRAPLRQILVTTITITDGLIPTSLGIRIGWTGRAAIPVTIIVGQSVCLLWRGCWYRSPTSSSTLVDEGARAWLAKGVGRDVRPSAATRVAAGLSGETDEMQHANEGL